MAGHFHVTCSFTHSLSASVSLCNSATSKKLQLDIFCTVGRSAWSVGQRAITSVFPNYCSPVVARTRSCKS